MTSDAAAAGFAATANGLITDAQGRWLIIRPVRREPWQLPGGPIEDDEPPRVALARAVREELGMFLRPGRLLSLIWIPPGRSGGRAGFGLLFELGELRNDRNVRLGPQD
ncbi:MAG: NUDIX domain-containing protein [Sporichthyaceae bacterium]|nr:NUDIX domain-containing protein [Sporichthyaceae bacterium]